MLIRKKSPPVAPEAELNKLKAFLAHAKAKIKDLETENMALSSQKAEIVKKAKVAIGKARLEAKNSRGRAKRLKAKLEQNQCETSP
jgi:hypothetical protein